MSDERLRELERRWKETGSLDEETAHLIERVRVGGLSQERLELAAYCGHEASAVASALPVSAQSDLGVWIRGLAKWGRVACGVATLAVAQLVRDRWSWNWDERLADALSAVSAWVECPCETHRLAAKAATSVATWAHAGYEDPIASQAANAICWASALAARSNQELVGVALDAVRSAQAAAVATSENEVSTTARRALIEWALTKGSSSLQA